MEERGDDEKDEEEDMNGERMMNVAAHGGHGVVLSNREAKEGLPLQICVCVGEEEEGRGEERVDEGQRKGRLLMNETGKGRGRKKKNGRGIWRDGIWKKGQDGEGE